MQNKIGIVDYLERVPNGYITKKQELLEKIKASQGAAAAAQDGASGPILDTNQPMEVVGGKGNGALQRAINKTGVTR